MRVCKFFDPQSGARVGLVEGDAVYDLTALDKERFASLAAFLELPDRVGTLARLIRSGISIAPYSYHSLDRQPHEDSPHLLPPIDRQEVWAAGVTYLRSRDARVEESESGGSFYDKVYVADRPELFFKSTPHRTVGPNASVRIRGDSKWNVPEPELALVLNSRRELVGFTIGNDMSSRDIEGENPLYLPQAKVYSSSCALGPVIRLAETVDHPLEMQIRLMIRRSETVVFQGDIALNQMKRSFEDLVDFLWRDNAFPDGAFLLTGTGIVPPDDFTLQPGDGIEIAVEAVGVLKNKVEG
ncbi:MAG: fumarylacetoacetate hydrolase family protein [Armatimonadetes bacterium]|nr:fumarylacetoacetate hydrolase family protein [Armatimonadota bacterium]